MVKKWRLLLFILSLLACLIVLLFYVIMAIAMRKLWNAYVIMATLDQVAV